MNVNFELIRNNAIATERTEAVVTTRRRSASCPICGRIVTPPAGVRITTPSHPRGLTLCDIHANVNNNEGYSVENTVHEGKRTTKGVTTSIELEAEDVDIVAKASMFADLHFICTSDGSLDYNGVEFKSRVYDSLNPLTKGLGTIQWLNEAGHFTTLTDNTSAHIHTGVYDDVVDFRRIYGSVAEYFEEFSGLYEYLEKMPNAKMKEYFGRGFTNYARTLRRGEFDNFVLPKHNGNGKRERYGNKILKASDNLYGTGSYDCVQHYLTFNLQHSYSIEFRLPKFINALQYRNCVLAMQDIVCTLRENNFKGVNDKMVKVFKKYFPY